MVDSSVLITGGVGVISSIISAWISWFFTRKKYNSEVDNNLILNMLKSLKFYLELSDDTRARLEDVLHRNEVLEQKDEALEEEIKELKKQVFNLMSNICMSVSCPQRIKDSKEIGK